ncbi:SIR2 family NAD-dependent protein deacylase [Ursidibacter sp. B-7004-1]
MKNDLHYAAELIKKADGILITAGAGMSVDSGLPDFRSSGGLWNAYPPLADKKIGFEQLATPAVYQNNPEIGYWFFAHRLIQYREAEPHQGYAILKQWAETKPLGYFVYTSNVDGQFQKAGFDPKRIYEIHGTIHRLQCQSNCKGDSWEAENFKPTVNNTQCRMTSEPPKCPWCNGLARQNVMMFNDWFFAEKFYQWQKLRLNQWLAEATNLVIIELGAGKSVPTVRYFSERTAKAKKAGFIRINPLDAGVPKMHFLSLEMGALEALIQIDLLLQE